MYFKKTSCPSLEGPELNNSDVRNTLNKASLAFIAGHYFQVLISNS